MMAEVKRKILIVDDDAQVLEYLKIRLGVKYDIVVTTRAGQAVDIARREMPDLVLCDIDMPEMSGGDVSNKFRYCNEVSKIPFMYLTSFVSPSEVLELEGRVGGRQGISKATETQFIIDIIESTIESRSK
jgi:CheY-like chemotaxis protein